LSPAISDGGVFIRGLDSLGHDESPQLMAKADRGGDEPLLTTLAVEPLDEVTIELDDARLEVGDVLQVRITGTEIVDDQMSAHATAYFA
jgi:hypothetical protein